MKKIMATLIMCLLLNACGNTMTTAVSTTSTSSFDERIEPKQYWISQYYFDMDALIKDSGWTFLENSVNPGGTPYYTKKIKNANGDIIILNGFLEYGEYIRVEPSSKQSFYELDMAQNPNYFDSSCNYSPIIVSIMTNLLTRQIKDDECPFDGLSTMHSICINNEYDYHNQ